MKTTRFLPAAALILSFLTGSHLPLSAANPPLPEPIPGGKTGSSSVGPAPGPGPCWSMWGSKKGKPRLSWPGAPPGAVWIGPIPACPKRNGSGGGSQGGRGSQGGASTGSGHDGGGDAGGGSTQGSRPTVSGGPSGNRGCPGHKDSMCRASSVSGPGRPSSILERTFLDIAPNQPGLGTGSLVYYVNTANDNFGDPGILEFYSIPSMFAIWHGEISGTSYAISQPDGARILFHLSDTSSAPADASAPNAASQTGVIWAAADGSATTKTLATHVRQFLPGYGWVHFPKLGGMATGLTTTTGRFYDFSTSAARASMGIEVIRKTSGGKYVSDVDAAYGSLRQVKTQAGLIDIVPISSRNFEIRQYAPNQVGAKAGSGAYKDLYVPTGDAVFKVNVDASSPLTVHQARIIRTLGTEVYNTLHTVSDDGVLWKQEIVNGGFSFVRTVENSTGYSEAEWHAWLTAVPSGCTIIPAPTGSTDPPSYYSLKNVSNNYFPLQSTETFPSGLIVEGMQNFPTTLGEPGTVWDKTTGTQTVSTYTGHKMTSQKFMTGTFVASGDIISSSDYTYDLLMPYVNSTTPFEPVIPFDFRPRTSTLSKGGNIVSKDFYAYPIIDGEYTEIHERATSAGAVFGSGVNVLRSEIRHYGTGSGVSAANKGRPRQSRAEDGTLTQYEYTELTGFKLSATVTDNLTSAGLPVSGSSTKSTYILDPRGLPEKITNFCYVAGLTPSPWLALEEYTCTWDNTGNPVETTRKDLVSSPNQVRIIQHEDWDGVRLIRHIDENGVTTEHDYFTGTVIPWRTRRLAIPADTVHGYPAQSEVVVTYTGQFSMDSQMLPVRTTTVTTTTAGTGPAAVTLVETEIRDEKGNLISRTDANGLTTTNSYSPDLTIATYSTYSAAPASVTTTFPSGGTEIHTFDIEGQLASITGTAVVPTYYKHGTLVSGGTTGAVYTGVNPDATPAPPASSLRFVKTEMDVAGRMTKSMVPAYTGGTIDTVSQYDSAGNLWKISSTGQPWTIYGYNAVNDVIKTTISGDNDSSSDDSQTDQVTDTEKSVQIIGGNPWLVTTTKVFATPGSSTRTTSGSTRRMLAGFTDDQVSISEQVDTSNNVSRVTSSTNYTSHISSLASVVPGASDNGVTIGYGGRTFSTHQRGSGAATVAVTYGYDAIGRLISTKLPHHANAETRAYAGSRLDSATDAAGSSVKYAYYPINSGAGTGQLKNITAPDTTVTTYTYDLKGRTTGMSGNTYPVAYEYTDYGELWKMTTWRAAPPAVGDVTTWEYQPSTGLLTSKTDAANRAVSYTYDSSNRLLTRLSPRSSTLTVTTTFSYNPNTGRLSGKVYTPSSADMPAEGFDYDRLGRLKKMTSGSATANSWEYAYDATTLLPATETMSLDTDSNGTADTTYVLYRYYDTLRRPYIVDLIVPGGSPFYRSTLAYETTAGRLLSVSAGGDTFTYGYKADAPGLVQTVTGGGVTVTNAWEANRDVLDWKENKAGTTVISKYDYTVNSMGRRTDLSETGSAYSGSPTVGWGYNTRGELTLQNHSNNSYDSAYEFDNVGNRRKASGTTTLPGSDNHTANSLNQYTSIGGVSPSYDFAGNLIADAGGNTSGSSRTYTWDGENRLVKVTTVSGGATLGTYRYDPMGRRYAKTADGATTWFLYDGWNVLSEIINGGQVRAHLWGLDLSGSAQGAGGVGGLLCSYTSSEGYRPLYDGNGNIVQYVTSSGSIAASYEYSPFGHLLASSGTVAPYLSYRFSTKYRDPETDFYYYGYRYYSSWMARWINRDPIGEQGGVNICSYPYNDPINYSDTDGRLPFQSGSSYLTKDNDRISYGLSADTSDCEFSGCEGCVGTVKIYMTYDAYIPAHGPNHEITRGALRDPTANVTMSLMDDQSKTPVDTQIPITELNGERWKIEKKWLIGTVPCKGGKIRGVANVFFGAPGYVSGSFTSKTRLTFGYLAEISKCGNVKKLHAVPKREAYKEMPGTWDLFPYTGDGSSYDVINPD